VIIRLILFILQELDVLVLASFIIHVLNFIRVVSVPDPGSGTKIVLLGMYNSVLYICTAL